MKNEANTVLKPVGLNVFNRSLVLMEMQVKCESKTHLIKIKTYVLKKKGSPLIQRPSAIANWYCVVSKNC